MSLYMNSLGEFVDRDSDADAELRRRKAYANLRAVGTSGLRGDEKRKAAGKAGAAKRAETMRGQHAGVMATCPWCGEKFEKRRSNQRFCTKYCQKKFSYERKKAR